MCVLTVQVVPTFPLPGCLDMWTVLGADSGSGSDSGAGSGSGSGDQHSFLLLSRPDATMVLQTGEAINELDRSGFQTAERTVLAGNLGERRFILQVGAGTVARVSPLWPGGLIVGNVFAMVYVIS